MSENDPIRQKWESEYSGRTDNGLELPISQVVPGAVIIDDGRPVGCVGYFPASRNVNGILLMSPKEQRLLAALISALQFCLRTDAYRIGYKCRVVRTDYSKLRYKFWIQFYEDEPIESAGDWPVETFRYLLRSAAKEVRRYTKKQWSYEGDDDPEKDAKDLERIADFTFKCLPKWVRNKVQK